MWLKIDWYDKASPIQEWKNKELLQAEQRSFVDKAARSVLTNEKVFVD